MAVEINTAVVDEFYEEEEEIVDSEEPSEEAIPEEGDTAEANESSEEEELVVTIGDAPAPEEESKSAPDWVKELRKSHRELQRENRQLKEKFKETDSAPKAPSIGPKPTMESVEWDTEKFEMAIADWYESKRKVDDYQSQIEVAQRKQQEEWQSKLNGYTQAKAQLKVKDFEDAEGYIQDVLSVTQQGIVLQGAENPALLIYALGKNQSKARELAAINDPVKFAFEIAKLEANLKTSNKRAAPPEPEKTVRGTGRISGGSGVDARLDKLREDAAKTGDFTKLQEYKRQLKTTR
jgi:hypothetical protein